MRATKVAIADALRDDPAVSALVPSAQVFAVERATVPSCRSIEVIAVTSERVGDGPMVKHELAVECTVSQSDRGRGRRATRWHRRGRTRPFGDIGDDGAPDHPGER